MSGAQVDARTKRQDADLAAAASTVTELLRGLDDVTPPLLLLGPAGDVAATTPSAGKACPLAAMGGSWVVSGDGRARCPVRSCRHHAHHRAVPLDRATPGAYIAHCDSEDGLDLLARSISASIDASRDITALLGDLARLHEEVNWLHGLGELIEEEIREERVFTEIPRELTRLLPVHDVRLWLPTRTGEHYRRLPSSESPNEPRILSRPSNADESLGVREIRIVRETPTEPGVERDLLLPMAEPGPPFVALTVETGGTRLGVLVLRLDGEDVMIDSARRQLLDAIARQTGLRLRIHSQLRELKESEGLKKEIEIARRIQHGLFPQRTPESESFDVFGGCVTAAKVGGDYYDVVEVADELGLLIADVSGHSIASGLIAMSFRSSFRHHLEGGARLGELFAGVNSSLYSELHVSGHFLSSFFARFDPSARLLRFVNAGHNPPFVYRPRTGEFLDLTESGLLIGILPHVEYPVGQLTLETDDVLVLYTDGIVEAENQHREVYGLERLKKSVVRHSERSAKQLYHLLLKDVYVFQDEFYNRDDVTMIVLRVLR